MAGDGRLGGMPIRSDDHRRSLRAPGFLSWRRLRTVWLGRILRLALVAANRPAVALNPQDRAVVGEAFAAADGGDWPRAFRLVEAVADPLPALTLRRLRMLEAREPDDFATIARFLLSHPEWPWPEELQIVAEGTITDPADHELIRHFRGPGAADHARHDPLRRGPVPDRPGPGRLAAADPPGLGRGRLLARRGAEVLRQVPAAADPPGSHRPARQSALGLPAAVGGADARAGARADPQAGERADAPAAPPGRGRPGGRGGAGVAARRPWPDLRPATLAPAEAPPR